MSLTLDSAPQRRSRQQSVSGKPSAVGNGDRKSGPRPAALPVVAVLLDIEREPSSADSPLIIVASERDLVKADRRGCGFHSVRFVLELPLANWLPRPIPLVTLGY